VHIIQFIQYIHNTSITSIVSLANSPNGTWRDSLPCRGGRRTPHSQTLCSYVPSSLLSDKHTSVDCPCGRWCGPRCSPLGQDPGVELVDGWPSSSARWSRRSAAPPAPDGSRGTSSSGAGVVTLPGRALTRWWWWQRSAGTRRDSAKPSSTSARRQWCWRHP